MSKLFDRSPENRRANARVRDEALHFQNLMIAMFMGVLAGGLVLISIITFSPLGFVGACVAATSPWCWMRSDRNRVDDVAKEHMGAYGREFGWAIAAIAALAAGYAIYIAAGVNGW